MSALGIVGRLGVEGVRPLGLSAITIRLFISLAIKSPLLYS